VVGPHPGSQRGHDVSARDAVMARIRSAIGAQPADVVVPRAYRTRGDHEPGSLALLDLFTQRLEDYRALVYRADKGALAATISRALTVSGVTRAAAAPGVGPWFVEGLDVLRDDPDDPLTVDALDGVDGVVTGCALALAVAETGTIVLDGSPACGRRALTLVPDYHLVVVRADQVVESVPEAVTRLDPRAPMTWVSGPSATSDIELSRVEGVHGPRTLAVVLVV
jgi:L-lactate dehydrogenase complex protein LldG